MPKAEKEILDLLFVEARTHKFFSEKPVTDKMLAEIYDAAKFGPTASNSCPMRIVFVRSKEAKERLIPALNPGNVEKTRAAPATAILAYDMEFYEKLPTLAPHLDYPSFYASLPEYPLEKVALRNATLQAAYFLVSARAFGLDCGPMSGFKNNLVDAEFFADSTWRSNFLMNLGFGTGVGIHERAARPPIEDACRFL